MGTRSIQVTVPINEMELFQEVINRMGWTYNPTHQFLDDYLTNCPKDVDMTEEDIMAEVAAVRYESMPGQFTEEEKRQRLVESYNSTTGKSLDEVVNLMLAV